MKFETELGRRLHAGADDAPVDVDRLIEAGRAEGRRLARRRRIGQAITATAAAAAFGGAIAVTASLNWPTAPAVGPAAAVTRTAATPPADDTLPITPQAAMRILIDLAPGDGKLSDYQGGTVGDPAKPEDVWVRPVHTDELGPSNLSLHLSSGEPAMDCSSDETCTTETLPNGDKLVLGTMRGPGNLEVHEVRLLRKDGWQLSLLADNAKDWKEHGTRPAPPFTLAQLKSILLSPRWQKSVPAELVTESADLFVPRRLPAKSRQTVPLTSPAPSGSPVSPQSPTFAGSTR